MRFEAFALALVVALSAKTVCAEDKRADAAPAPETTSKVAFAGGHVAYALGPAVGDDSGFRQGLDVGAMAGIASYSGGSSSGLPGKSSGLVFGASSLIGFGKYPSYVAGEIGGGEDNAFTGGFGVIGPAVRVDPKAGGGLALRLGGDVFLLEVGLHLIAILVPDRDVVFAFTVGVGRD
jgi:hypothetical protein